jgi:ribosomal protein S18 acetylase RimI-like enzyme
MRHDAGGRARGMPPAMAAKRRRAAATSAPRTRKRPPPSEAPPPVARTAEGDEDGTLPPGEEIRVRRMHRRDLNRVWEFLKLVFRGVNRQTLEYQRPRSKQRFTEQYDDEGIEQLVFEVSGDIVGYAECAYEVTGSDNWINPRFFEARDMRPLFVEELASHPDYQGRGVGSFMLEQLQHLARVRGCTHLVLEVAENNDSALRFYRKRSFYKLDAAIFLAQKVPTEPELLPPRRLEPPAEGEEPQADADGPPSDDPGSEPTV